MKKLMAIIIIFLLFQSVSFAYKKTMASASSITTQEESIQQELPKLVLDASATTIVLNNKVYLCYGHKRFNISNYDFYYYPSLEYSFSFYVGDVLKDFEPSLKVYMIQIYYNEEFDRFSNIIVQVYESQEGIYYNFKSTLSLEAIDLLTFNTPTVDLLDESVISERLNDSLLLLDRLRWVCEVIPNPYEKRKSSRNPYAVVTKPIPEESQEEPISEIDTNFYTYNSSSKNYDSYTDSDGIINEYVDNYFGHYKLKSGLITDDPIIQIIPKELFFERGTHLYIGREYGFFVNTYNDTTNPADNMAEIFVFDIIKEKPNFPAGKYEGKVRVAPIFKYKFRAADKSKRYGIWEGFDSSLSQIVYQNMTKLKEKGPVQNNNNCNITYDFIAGQDYYIVAKCLGDATGSFKVEVSMYG